MFKLHKTTKNCGYKGSTIAQYLPLDKIQKNVKVRGPSHLCKNLDIGAEIVNVAGKFMCSH